MYIFNIFEGVQGSGDKVGEIDRCLFYAYYYYYYYHHHYHYYIHGYSFLLTAIYNTRYVYNAKTPFNINSYQQEAISK